VGGLLTELENIRAMIIARWREKIITEITKKAERNTRRPSIVCLNAREVRFLPFYRKRGTLPSGKPASIPWANVTTVATAAVKSTLPRRLIDVAYPYRCQDGESHIPQFQFIP